MPRLHLAERREDRLGAPRELALPVRQHLRDHLALRVRLRAAERAGDDREAARARIARDLALRHVGERPDHDMAPVVRAQLRRHRLEPPAEEQVQEQRLDDVVAMMTERDLADAVVRRPVIERAAAQPRAQAAHRPACRDHALDDAVGVLLDHVERHAERAEILGQHLRRKARLLLVEVDRHELEAHRRRALQRQQDVEQRVGVLAAREADHDLVAVLDHAIVADRLADQAAQLRLQLAEAVRRGEFPGTTGLRGSRDRVTLHAVGILASARPLQAAALEAGTSARYFASR